MVVAVPAGHGEHTPEDDAPVAFKPTPEGHAVHEVEASTSEYEAAGQGTQSDDWPPDVAYEPALHSWQSDAEIAPAGATDPAGHALQLEVQLVQPLAAQ